MAVTLYPIITASELIQRLEHQELVLVDTRFKLQDASYGRRVYGESHLPGAVYLDLNDDLSGPVGARGGRHPLPDLNQLSQKLGACGIHAPAHVVAYDDAYNMYAGRLWWLLRYLGHTQVQVLDGGFSAWQALGYPLSHEWPTPKPQVFVPQLHSTNLITHEELIQRLHEPGLLLLDARSADRYRGENETLDPRGGHIPGALNRPFMDNLIQGLYKTAPQLQLELNALGANQAQEIVVYCGSGVSANQLLIALAAAGFNNTRLYAGSWSDWCRYPDVPMVTGSDNPIDSKSM